MKKNIFYMLMAIYSSLAFGQDSVRINKSHFNFQTGFANYHFNFNGVYMSGGYSYAAHKYILLESKLTLSSGKEMSNLYYRPQYEFKSLMIGPMFHLNFLRRNIIRAGIGIAFSTIDVSRIIGEHYSATNMIYQPVVSYIKVFTFNTEYSLSYLFRFSNRLKAGVNFSQSALGIFHKYSGVGTENLNLYGTRLEFSF
jgi:hypothetical protein